MVLKNCKWQTLTTLYGSVSLNLHECVEDLYELCMNFIQFGYEFT